MANNRVGLFGGLLALLGLGGVGSLAAVPKVLAHSPEFAAIAARSAGSAVDDVARGAALYIDDGIHGVSVISDVENAQRYTLSAYDREAAIQYFRSRATAEARGDSVESIPKYDGFVSRAYAKARDLGLDPHKLTKDVLENVLEECLTGCVPDVQQDREEEPHPLLELAARDKAYFDSLYADYDEAVRKKKEMDALLAKMEESRRQSERRIARLQLEWRLEQIEDEAEASRALQREKELEVQATERQERRRQSEQDRALRELQWRQKRETEEAETLRQTEEFLAELKRRN